MEKKELTVTVKQQQKLLILQKLPAEAKKPLELAFSPMEKIGLIRNYTGLRYNDKVGQINEWLLAISMFVGINPAPPAALRLMIIGFLIDMYPNFSLPEIEYAFKLALAGGLDIAEKDRLHYGTLNSQWVSNILNGYKKHLNKHLQDFEYQKSRLEVAVMPQRSDDEVKKIMINAIDGMYKAHLNKDEWHDMAGSAFDWLHQSGHIAYTPEQMQGAEQKAAEFIKAELNEEMYHANTIRKTEFKAILESIENKQPNSRVSIRAKKILLTDFFNTSPNIQKL